MSSEIVPQQQGAVNGHVSEAGLVKRREFGADQLQHVAETSAMAVAAQARAAVESRYIVAMRQPRDWDMVRKKLIHECKRTGFALSARYAKPVGGGKVEGFSIRFAESAMRCMTNLMPEITTIYDDARQRIVRVSLTDLEGNLTFVKDVPIAKVVERQKPKAGQTILSSRLNSKGETVFLVEANDDELLNKENALVSKALRNHVLRLIPGDIQDDCLDQIHETLRQDNKQDPDRARKKLIDAFAEQGVQPADLKSYLGHDITTNPAEMAELRAIYAGIRDGETTWAAVMAEKDAATDEANPDAPRTVADLVAKAKNDAAKKIKVKGADGKTIEVEDAPTPPSEPENA